MVELDSGSGVFVYPSHLAEVGGKVGDAIPRYLLNCFYSTSDLVVAHNLTGNHGKPGLEKPLVDAIIGTCFFLSTGLLMMRLIAFLLQMVLMQICVRNRDKNMYLYKYAGSVKENNFQIGLGGYL